MGIFGGKPEASGSTAAAPPKERREPSSPAALEAPTIIGRDTTVKGELTSSTDMLIEGRVEGEIHGAHRVIIGESGEVDARVAAQIVTVRGTVRGDCEGSQKVEITATGKVFGNISSRAIVVAEGATFRGASKMSQPEAVKPSELRRAEPEKHLGAASPEPPSPSSRPI